MHTIITISKSGAVSGKGNYKLEKKLHGLHPEATKRITIISDYTSKTLSLENILEIAILKNCAANVLQFVEYTGKQRRDQRSRVKPDYYKYEVDFKFNEPWKSAE